MVRPTSRTYIPASLADNPYYAASGEYQRQLDGMPEPYRSLLMGGFRVAFQDAPNQVIPTAWVTAAQARWMSKPPAGVPMCAMGVDVTGGGTDPMIIAIRHDGWYAPMVVVPAKDLPVERAGRMGAGIVVTHRRNGAKVIVDMGGGFGIPMYEQLKANEIDVHPYKGGDASVRRTKDGSLKFFNKRSEAVWKFREALDPDQIGGSPIMLPEDPTMVADLTALTLDMEFNGIKCESKETLCDRLGRSTDRGDAVIMAWSKGARAATHIRSWEQGNIGLRVRLQSQAITRTTRRRL